MSGRNRSNIRRQRLAYEAARIMVDQGIRGFGHARRKAAERAGIDDRRLWPKNGEIQAALLQQQRLFQGAQRESELTGLRAGRPWRLWRPSPILRPGWSPCLPEVGTRREVCACIYNLHALPPHERCFRRLGAAVPGRPPR